MKTNPNTPLSIYHRFNRPKPKGLTMDPKEGMTQQDFKEECDVNNIVKRYADTGLWSQSLRPPTSTPMFGDFTTVPEFFEAQNIIAKASEHFASLPSEVRFRFNNDPAQLLAFVSDPKNTDEAIALGIANPRPTGESPAPGAAPAAPSAGDKPGAK